jgi:hypothetical protein
MPAGRKRIHNRFARKENGERKSRRVNWPGVSQQKSNGGSQPRPFSHTLDFVGTARPLLLRKLRLHPVSHHYEYRSQRNISTSDGRLPYISTPTR